MPKKVDHRARRTLIADALMRVAAHRGLEAVSLRHVATEAGVSAGMVQHYFATKDEMMMFAMAVVRDLSQARVAEAVSRLGGDPPPRALLRTIIATLLPLDDESGDHARVALAFLAYTAVRPTAAAALRDDTDQMLSAIAGLVPGPDAARTAAALLALMEGLGVYLLSRQYTPAQALDVLDAQLNRIFRPGAG